MSGTTNITDMDFFSKLGRLKTDHELGLRVSAHLKELGCEHPFRTPEPFEEVEGFDYQGAVKGLEEGVRELFRGLDLRLDDESLRDTPSRYACMMVGELTKGLNYELFPKCTATPAHDDQMVVVQGIQVMSLCEHHLQTIDGHAHIAYIPNKKLLGLSKLARVTEFFSRRPQVQERLTSQIFHALSLILETEDVAVVIKATHYCMKARGALQSASVTSTNKMGGRFLSQPAAREEFFNVVR